MFAAVRRPRRGTPEIASVPPPKRHPYNQWTPDARALDLVGDKWTLLIIRDLAAGPRRFVELQRVLPGISTEQLRSRLNRMVADELLTRKRYREVPPRVDYELTERAQELLPVVGALARWGSRWAWSRPQDDEAIDICAIMRILPGIVAPSQLSGTVLVEVDYLNGSFGISRISAEDGAIRVVEGHDAYGPADATIAGDVNSWIGALSPDESESGLQFDGDRQVAAAFLELIEPAFVRVASIA
ncbi:MAG TPA: helix-turn-helix domain-containing protein [Baekduia sp.]|nr:helix-turn-helix domain-containing protein [Baekduia sp.]